MNEALDGIPDPRDREASDYALRTILWTPILMFACRLGSRRQIQHLLNTPRVTAHLRRLAAEELARVPHGDAVANVLVRLSVEALSAVRTDLVRQLIKARRLEKFRLLGSDYLFTLDGTGHLVLGNEPSEFTVGCLTQKLSSGETLYYRPVLEAKLVTRTGLALSVGTEFLENRPRREGESEDDYKQDCELKGAYRLLPGLKKAFPELSVCLLGDGLYACDPFFALAEKLGWHFLVVLPEKSLPTVQREFHSLIALAPQNTLARSRRKARQVLRWINGTAYGGHSLNVLECIETPKDGSKPTRWLWVTNIPITPENAFSLANEGGRQRWRTENEGFNVQKNGGYAMEHAYAKNPTAARIFYLLLQIAHLLVQLFEAHLGGKKDVTHECGSLANLARLLLEALRTDPLPTDEEITAFLDTPIQVRLDVDTS